MKSIDLIKEVSTHVSEELLTFYRMDLPVDNIHDFIVIQSSSGLPYNTARVCHLEPKDLEETFWINLEINQEFLLTFLNKPSPLEKLTLDNINLLLVLTEEISHFIDLCRAHTFGHQLSKLDLELMGELDKMIIAAKILHAQTGDFHVEALFHKMFYQSVFHDSDHIYNVAELMAGKWWKCHLRKYGLELIAMEEAKNQLIQIRNTQGGQRWQCLKESINSITPSSKLRVG